jgi:peptidoglycan/LPS O-acetylase OafA/YrhL
MYYHFVVHDEGVKSRLAKVFVGCGRLGWIGVDVFFVLSGFLITRILLRAKGRPSYFRSFYMRRVLRIFPLYYGVLLVIFGLIPLVYRSHDPDVLRIYGDQMWLWTYSSNILNAIRGDFAFNADWLSLNHFWTLCVEEHFYLVWPALVLFLNRRMLVRVSLGIMLLVPILRTVLVSLHVSAWTLLTFTPCRFDALVMGGLLAIGASERDGFRQLLRWAPFVFGASVAALMVIVCVKHQGSASLAPLMQSIGYSLLGTASGALLILALSPRANWLTRNLQNRALAGLGKYSYGAYVLHQLLQPTFFRWFPPARIAAATGSELAGVVGHAALGFVLSIAAALLSWHAYEKHFLRLKKYFTYSAPPANVPEGGGVMPSIPIPTREGSD